LKAKTLISQLILAAGLVLTMAACSITPSGSAGVGEEQVPDPAETSAAALYDFVTEENGFMPYVNGMNLVQAKSVVEASGLRADFYDASPLKQAIENESDWFVVRQPEVAEKFARGATVSLGAYRKGDPTDSEPSVFAFELRREDPIAPNFVGMKLSEVQDIADKTDMYISTEDASDEDRSVFSSGNWEVLKQNRIAGRPMNANSMNLTIQKIGENFGSTKSLDGHHGEMQFYGTITGHTGESSSWFGPSKINFVQVDGAMVALDMIGPYTYGCLDAGSVAAAEKEKRDVLPIGTKVRVVRTDAENPELAAIHFAENDDLLNPFKNSVNQKLVEGGYWIPIQSTNYGEVSYSSKLKYKIDDIYTTYLQKRYLKLLVQAATVTRSARVGGQKTCVAMALKYEKDQRIAAVIRKRDEARWAREAERQRRIWADAHSCAGGARDGDGDGICNE
jgi:hypothetical protein